MNEVSVMVEESEKSFATYFPEVIRDVLDCS